MCSLTKTTKSGDLLLYDISKGKPLVAVMDSAVFLLCDQYETVMLMRCRELIQFTGSKTHN